MEYEHELSPQEKEEKEALRAQIQSYFKEEDECDYYEIPLGTELFSGYRDKLEKYKFETAISQPKFFGFNAKTAEIYGYVFAYITTKSYKLFAMDSLKTLEYLYRNYKKIRKVLRKNYGYDEKKIADAHRSGKKFIQIRTSTKSTDLKLVQYLCEKGFSGYATNFMVEDAEGTFHPECAICTLEGGVELNPRYQSKNILGKKIIGLVTPDSEIMQEYVNGLIIKDTQLKNTEEYTGKKRRESIFGPHRTDSSPPGTPLRIGLLSFDNNSPLGKDSPQAGLLSFDNNSPLGKDSPQAGLLSFDNNSPLGKDSPQAGLLSFNNNSPLGKDSPQAGFLRRGSLFDSPNKRHKTKGGKTRKQKRNASKKGIKSLRNKSYNNVRRRKVSNRRN